MTQRTKKAPPRTRCADCPELGCPVVPRGCFERPDIAFVGEAPGADEEREGYPFVGRSGKLLRTTAQSVGIDLARVLYTNVLMWRPEGNRDPKPYEVDACSERLLNELVEADPRLIVTVGGISANALLRSKQGILKRHGAYREIEIDGKQYGVFPIIHPASVFRQPDLFLFLYHDLFKVQQILDGHPPVLEPDWDQYLLIDRQALFYALCDRIREQELVSIDIEATDLDYQKGHILCVGFSWKRGTAAVLDWQKLIVGQPDNLEMLRAALQDVPAAFQGGQFDNPYLWENGVEPWWKIDTMFAHYTINEIQGSHGLKRQAIDRYWAPLYDDTLKDALHAARKAGTIPTRVKSRSRGRVDALGLTEDEDEEKETKAKTGDDRKEALDIPIEAWSVPELRQMVMKYCGADVDYTLRLAEDLTEEMEQEDVLGVHDRLLLPAGVHFAWLEEVGMKVDVEYHNRLGAEWQQAQDEICRRLFEISESWDWPGTPSGRPWWSSHVRLKRYLYDELRLRKMISSRRDGKLTQNEVLQEIQDLEEEADEDAVDYWRTASSAVFSNMKPDSTNTYMLFWLASQHEFPRTMVDWRILDKKLGTYYHGYRNIMRRGGRIHPRFRITGARTGRVSCTDPNIHGVARKKEIKRIFVADEDYVILYSDRSQAEIRMLAHMSGDESLRHACESEDMHFAIACDLFQLTPEQLRAKGKEQVEFMRRAAKTIAFGIIYGRMPDSLAPQLGCTVQEATVYRERFLSRMRQARQWIEAQKRRVLHEREVTSIYGRKRRFPIILDNAHKSEVERQAVNAPIQGAVSDMTLEDMLKIVRELDKRGIRVLPWPHVHDGQMLQVQKSKIGEALKIARDVLDNPSFQTRVRFAYELATGPGWADLETVFKG